MRIELRAPVTDAEIEKYNHLRWRVLGKPWGESKPPTTVDSAAFHLAAWDGDKLIGCGRIEFLSPEEAQVRGMAVDPEYASRGIGSSVLQALEEHAARAGVKRIVLHGRENALAFYRRNGYQQGEQSYIKYGSILHWRMHKDL
jgi:ribosomal protein S18 acetylase RimI-like enzyme